MAAWSKKREVMYHYDRLAKVYDLQYAQEQEAKLEAALSSIRFSADSVALDLGCGTGLLFRRAGDSVSLLVGIDISTRILREAKKQAKKHQNVILLRADADWSPFQCQTFDTVFAITLLQNTPTPKRTLREIKRITKPNATIVLTGLKKEFPLARFRRLLESTEFGAGDVKIDDDLKDYIAIRKKL
jgi:ubiquinone/menaquinone biosynthesis C-methylase UbiE